MPRPGRSRSPNLEIISRTLAGFGRYPDKRPRGLSVDRNGTMLLDDLMRCWGHAEGLSKEVVLDAARQHMFQDSQRRDMRFVIDCNRRGQMTIKVLPKRQPRAAATTPERGGGASWRERSRPTPPHASAPSRRRERGCDRAARREAFEPKFQAQAGPPPRATAAQPLASEKKLDMGLDDIIACEHRPLSAPLPARPGAVSHKAAPPLPPPPLPLQSSRVDGGSAHRKGERVRHMLAQMGHTSKTKHVRNQRQHGSRARLEQAPQDWHHRRTGDMIPSEKIQRWVAWVMKKGHSELGVAIESCGASCTAQLDELAEAMRTGRPEFGQLDARGLQTLLADSDQAGRFEFSDGRVRLVPRGDRLAHASPRSQFGNFAPRSRTAGPTGCRSRSSSLSSSVGSSRGSIDDGAQSFGISTPRCPAEERTARQAPVPPPWDSEGTDEWTRYVDEEHGNWWHYKGPRGEWCVMREGEAPQQYDAVENGFG